jgi:serine/threonine protein phosphatase PrpC
VERCVGFEPDIEVLTVHDVVMVRAQQHQVPERGRTTLCPVADVVRVAPGDRLLLCTDGLTNSVTEKSIAALLGIILGAATAVAVGRVMPLLAKR